MLCDQQFQKEWYLLAKSQNNVVKFEKNVEILRFIKSLEYVLQSSNIRRMNVVW